MRACRYLTIILLSLFAGGIWTDASAAWFKKKDKTEKTVSTKKKDKSAYDKFLSKKGLVSEGSVLKIYKNNKEIWLEIPDSLLGRKVLVSTYLLENSSAWITPGVKVSSDNVYILGKTDSLLIFRQPASLPVSSDSTISKAVELSKTSTDAFAFPIKYRNNDSTTVLVNVSKLFNPANKKIFRLTGLQINGDFTATSASPETKFTNISKVVAFSKSVGVVQNLTFNVSGGFVMGNSIISSGTKERLTGDFITSITLLKSEGMSVRYADDRVGVRTSSLLEVDANSGFKTKNIARRWNLSENQKITVYVDTLLPLKWRQAIAKGIEAWNPAFEKLGLGKVLNVRLFPSFGEFDAYDPMITKVLAAPKQTSERISASLSSDYTTGEILSASISIPGGYLDRVRKESVFTISDVDKRYNAYDISEDAVCEFLRAEMTRVFGLVLGLAPNYAASTAYTPSELRSPVFTKVNGITPSVMDNVIFNILARPGDKERGVQTIVDRIGKNDYFTVEWLYRTFPENVNEKEALSQLLDSKKGMREYIYLPETKLDLDPRKLSSDLGSDPFESYESEMRHLKNAFANSVSWLQYIDNETFKTLFLEYGYLRLVAINTRLSSLVGGVYCDYYGSGNQVFAPVPKQTQKRALDKVLSSLEDLSWVNSNKDLLYLNGATWGFDYFLKGNLLSQTGLHKKYYTMNMSDYLTHGAYSYSEFADDMIKYLTRNISKGKIGVGDDLALLSFINSYFVKTSDVLSANLKRSQNGGNMLSRDVDSDTDWVVNSNHDLDFSTDAGTALYPKLNTYPAAAFSDVGQINYRKLETVRKILENSVKKAENETVKGKIGFVLSFVNSALGKN